MRKRLWQLHSWLGLIAGLGLILIGVSGSMLVFHDELDAVFTPDAISVTPTQEGRLPLDTLLYKAEEQLPDYEVTGWLVRRDQPHFSDTLYLIRHNTTEWQVATIDQYNGKILSSPASQDQKLYGWLLKFHYEFFADDIGIFICGLLSVALFLLGVSGIYLHRKFWKHLFTLRWKNARRIFFSDLHKAVGIWSALFNLILGFTGAYWNFAHVIEHLSGHEYPQPTFTQRLYPETLSLENVMADAAKQLPGFQTNFISLPSNPDSPIIVLWGSVPSRNPFRDSFGTTLSYDPKTGQHTTTADIRDAGIGRQIVDMFRPLHYGNFGGLPIKILWCIGGLTPGVLAVTGFVMWWQRTRQKRK
ncbi:MAG: PepSY domain-containing protein [Puniceicoccales bacterium]|jgi:uncharacterized iron-regulated membrane protein|nr:PepSY domain-containing protein [Puniceicoccales bacterium]